MKGENKMMAVESKKLADNFEDLITDYLEASPNSSKGRAIIAKLIKQAKTFEQWGEIHSVVPVDSKAEETALAGMIETAKTYRHWKKLHNMSGWRSDLEKKAFAEMEKLESKD